MLMRDSYKKIDKSYSSLPSEFDVGLSTFDLQLIHQHRKRYVPVFNRKEQISYPDEMQGTTPV